MMVTSPQGQGLVHVWVFEMVRNTSSFRRRMDTMARFYRLGPSPMQTALHGDGLICMFVVSMDCTTGETAVHVAMLR
jgi:hypothetical protein